MAAHEVNAADYLAAARAWLEQCPVGARKTVNDVRAAVPVPEGMEPRACWFRTRHRSADRHRPQTRTPGTQQRRLLPSSAGLPVPRLIVALSFVQPVLQLGGVPFQRAHVPVLVDQSPQSRGIATTIQE